MTVPQSVISPIEEGGDPEPPREGLLRAIERTRATIEEETAALSSSARADHSEFRLRKDICLLDLSRRVPAFDRGRTDPILMTALLNLKDAIIRNQTMLRCHVNAARTVSAIILETIAEEESDKTYSRRLTRKSAWP